MRNFFYIFIAFLSTACSKENNCLVRANRNAVKTIEIPTNREIKFIVLNDDINLEITQEPKCCELKIEAPENLIESVSVEFKGDTLILGNKNRCFWHGKLNSTFTAKLSLKELYRIENNSSGNIYTKNPFTSIFFWMDCYGSSGDVIMEVNVNELIILQHTGMSNFEIRGSAQNFDLLTGAKGIGNYQNLYAPKINLRQFGSGDTFIKSNDSIWIEIRGIGDVYLNGNPVHIDLIRSGKGNLIIQ